MYMPSKVKLEQQFELLKKTLGDISYQRIMLNSREQQIVQQLSEVQRDYQKEIAEEQPKKKKKK